MGVKLKTLRTDYVAAAVVEVVGVEEVVDVGDGAAGCRSGSSRTRKGPIRWGYRYPPP